MFYIQINENGLISFGKPYPNAYPTTLPDMSDHQVPYVAGFVGAIHTPSNISYIMLSEKNCDVFYESKADILNLLREGFGDSMAAFDMTHLLVVTWESAAFEGYTNMVRSIIFYVYAVHIFLHIHTPADCNFSDSFSVGGW